MTPPKRILPHYDSSALMSAYNYAKAWTRATSASDDKRVDRAFGYLQGGSAAEKWEEYGTTAISCGCPDYRVRQLACKHLLSRMIHIKYLQLMGEETGADLPIIQDMNHSMRLSFRVDQIESGHVHIMVQIDDNNRGILTFRMDEYQRFHQAMKLGASMSGGMLQFLPDDEAYWELMEEAETETRTLEVEK